MDDVDGTQPATSVAHSASMFRDVWRLPFGPMLAPTSAVLWAYAGPDLSWGHKSGKHVWPTFWRLRFGEIPADICKMVDPGRSTLDSPSNFTFEGSSCRMATILCACA